MHIKAMFSNSMYPIPTNNLENVFLYLKITIKIILKSEEKHLYMLV